MCTTFLVTSFGFSVVQFYLENVLSSLALATPPLAPTRLHRLAASS